MAIRVRVPSVHQLATEPEHVREGKLDWHTATSGATRQAYENHDLLARIEELLRHGLDVVEDIEKLLDTPLDSLAAEVSALPDLGLRELDVGRQKVQVDPLPFVESRVDRLQRLDVLVRNKRSPRRLGQWFQRNALAETLELANQALR